MSLKSLESIQTNQYFQTGNFSTGDFQFFAGPFGPPPVFGTLYVDRLDAMLAVLGVNAPSTFGLGQFDPRFVDNTGPLAKYVISTPNPSFMAIGEWDQQAETQALYGGINTANDEFWPIDQSTLIMTDIGSSLWPFFWQNSNASLATIGGYDDGPTASMGSDHVFFETWGYAVRVARVRHTDNVLYRGLCQIDLVTGLATLLDVPAVYTNTPAALFETFSFQGDDFILNGLQFVRDDDSSPGAPKGRLFMHSSEFLSDAGNVDNTDWRQYMKTIEWNPLGVSPQPGNAPRVHLRELQFTRLNFIERQAFGTNLNSLGTKIDGGTPIADGNLRSRFHPPTRTFITINEHYDGLEQERGFVRTSLVPALAQVQTPTQLSEVETNKVVRFRSRALGDIGDVVAGAVATWSADRRSTLNEVIDTSLAPPTSTLANIPVDEDSQVISLNGTPLVEGVDYTFVFTTGVITWIGAQSPPALTGYTATYRHSNTPAQPPHGTLLQLGSRSDEQGVAETQLQYPDDADLALQQDNLNVSITDD